MRKLAQWIYLIFFTFLPLLFTINTSELFEFPKFIWLLTASILILFCYLFDGLVSKDWTIPRSRHPITISIFAILATQILATIFSIHPHTSFWGYYSRFHQGLLTTISYTILYLGILKYLDLRTAQKIIKSTVVVGAILGALAILEHLNISVTCPLINGSFTDSCWKETTNPLYRSFATLGQPNWLAAYLIPLLYLLLYLYQSAKVLNPRQNIMPYLLGFALIFLGILFTKSRSGYLATGASALVYFVLTLRHSGHSTFIKILPKIALTVFIVLVIYLFPTWWQSQTATPPPASSDTALATISTSSGEIRKIVWSGALKLVKERPLLGFGPETFAYTYYQARPVAHNYTTEWDFLYNKAHNEYLNFAATSGILGLGAYLLYHFYTLLFSWQKVVPTKKINREKEIYQKLFRPAVGATVTSFAITNFFGFSIIPVYALMILVSALPLISFSDKYLSTKLPLRRSLIFTLLTAIALVIFPVRFFLADVYYQLGKAASSLNQTEEAAKSLSLAHTLRPSEDLYTTYLAEVYAGKGERVQALELIDQTKNHNDIHQNYLKSRAKAYLILAVENASFYNQAVSELERAATLAPTDPKLFYNLGLVYSRLGRTPDAVQSMSKSLELKNNYYEPYYALTLLYESTKQEKLIPDLLRSAKSHLPTIPDPLQAKIEKYLGK